MMNRNRVIILCIAAMAVALGGCQSKKPRATADTGTSVPTSDQSLSSGADSGSAVGSAGQVAANGVGVAGPTQGQLANRVIYFDFDSSDVKSDYNDLITAHARYLSSNPTIRVRLEGNTDERGSREYNIGLGERRAQAVRRALMLQGVSESQLTTVSYGEERPAITGHTEDAWSKNRRVEIVYLN